MEISEDVRLDTPSYQDLESILMSVETQSPGGREAAPIGVSTSQMQESGAENAQQETEVAYIPQREGGLEGQATPSGLPYVPQKEGGTVIYATPSVVVEYIPPGGESAPAATGWCEYQVQAGAGNEQAAPGQEQRGCEEQPAQGAAPALAQQVAEAVHAAVPTLTQQVVIPAPTQQVGAISRVSDIVREERVGKPHFPTPFQIGDRLIYNVTLDCLTTRDIAKIAAEVAVSVCDGKMENLQINMGPPRDVNNPMLKKRKPIEMRVFLAHVRPTEVLKAGAGLGGICRLPSQRVQFLRIRHNGEITERLPRVANPLNFHNNETPEWCTAEYKLTAGIDWRLLQDLPQFRNSRTYAEFDAVTSAVEHMLKCKFQIEYLKCYGGGGLGIRLDYRSFRNEKAGVVYLGYPERNDPGANPIAGWHPLTGIDYSTERLESEYHTMPIAYKT